jgi:hypothetical protein
MKKYFIGMFAVLASAITVLSFTTKNSHKPAEASKKVLDYELFQFNGSPGEEDDYTQYDWVNQAPTGCEGQGSVCYIEALRASSNPADDDYTHPQFDVSGGFPIVDLEKVMSLQEKGTSQ